MTASYDDIINLPHPISLKHPRMANIDRAAQFSPFAALTGYDSAVKETARLTETRLELDDDARAILNDKLRLIAERLHDKVPVTITYFLPDALKTGGAYISATDAVKKVDVVARMVVLLDGTKIPMDDILHIESALFDSFAR